MSADLHTDPTVREPGGGWAGTTAEAWQALEPRQRRLLMVLCLGALGVVVAFLFVDVTGSLDYALRLRGRKVAAMILVAVAIGVSTVSFQTVTNNRILTRQLIAVAVLVAVATALVGPITFLGLLVANLARQLLRASTHRLVLPAAALLGIIALVGGQLILERVLGYATAISIVVNVIGGVYFLALLLREARR